MDNVDEIFYTLDKKRILGFEVRNGSTGKLDKNWSAKLNDVSHFQTTVFHVGWSNSLFKHKEGS